MSWLRPAGRLCLALALAGCASPRSVVPAAAARLRIVNLAACAWSLRVTPEAGGSPRIETVKPGADLSLAVAPGRFSVEQILIGATGRPVATRRFAATFEPGVTYEWRLATLLSLGPVTQPLDP